MSQVRQPQIMFTILLVSIWIIAYPASSAESFNSLTVPGERAFPESISAASDGTLYVSSLASGGIARIKPGASTAESWIKPGAFDSRSTFGVLVDERSNLLWVCSNDVSGMGVSGPSSIPGSYLKGFDLATGEGKVSAAFPGSNNLCNDIAIAPDGSVYVTNSRAPQILRLKPDRKELEVWLEDKQFDPPKSGAGLDGIAIGGNGNMNRRRWQHVCQYLYQGRVFPRRHGRRGLWESYEACDVTTFDFAGSAAAAKRRNFSDG
jgi:streptogramin lyase